MQFPFLLIPYPYFVPAQCNFSLFLLPFNSLQLFLNFIFIQLSVSISSWGWSSKCSNLIYNLNKISWKMWYYIVINTCDLWMKSIKVISLTDTWSNCNANWGTSSWWIFESFNHISLQDTEHDVKTQFKSIFKVGRKPRPGRN